MLLWHFPNWPYNGAADVHYRKAAERREARAMDEVSWLETLKVAEQQARAWNKGVLHVYLNNYQKEDWHDLLVLGGYSLVAGPIYNPNSHNELFMYVKDINKVELRHLGDVLDSKEFVKRHLLNKNVWSTANYPEPFIVRYDSPEGGYYTVSDLREV